jgi:hypothetical protein
MAAQEQDAAAPHPVEIVESGMPAFYVSSFNLSTTSNEVVLIGNELFPTWGGNEAAPAARAAPAIGGSAQPAPAKDLADVLTNFVANYEQAYGELRTDYLLRKQTRAV